MLKWPPTPRTEGESTPEHRAHARVGMGSGLTAGGNAAPEPGRPEAMGTPHPQLSLALAAVHVTGGVRELLDPGP